MPESGMRTKTFRTYDQDTLLLMPPSVRDWVDPDWLAGLHQRPRRRARPGTLPRRPRRAPRHAALPPRDDAEGPPLWLCGRRAELAQARGAARAAMSASCSSRGRHGPDHKTISEFRRRHLEAFERALPRHPPLCQEAGLVKLGRVALDGTKLKAECQQAQGHELCPHGRARGRPRGARSRPSSRRPRRSMRPRMPSTADARGDELPEALRTREGRLREHPRGPGRAGGRGQERSGDPDAVPGPQGPAQLHRSRARIMRSRPDGWIQGYNARRSWTRRTRPST